ncbi:MAG: LysR family transcriptional regulator [Acidovorax sp.]|jgi:DNA-binding transcriptional LysR family regulator|nr:LysR family transcriptional regulator [Acidovorax sp.]
MNLRQLEVFQAVLQTGNMSAAARLLCITPSAVSKAIAHTELQLGYRLFLRTPSGLTPTPEAQVLATESTGIYRQLDALRRTARNLAASDSGDVRLAAIPSITHEFLPRLLHYHALQHPQVGVEVRTIHQDQMTQALLTRSVDFGLGFYQHPHPQVASDLLVSGQLYLAVAASVWGQAPRTASPGARLAQVPVIRLVGDDPMRQSIDEIAHRLGSPAGPGIQVQTSRLALDLVRLGMGWTVVDFLTARGLDPAQMVTLELHELAPISLYSYQARAFAPSLQATRMLAMLPRLLHEALQGNGKPAKR